MSEVPVQSVKKAMDLLGVLAFEDPGRNGIGVRELASRMGIPANSAHNLLKTLHHCGAVTQTEDRRYAIGPLVDKMARVGVLVAEETREAVAPVLMELRNRLGETVSLTTLAAGRWISLCHAKSTQPVQLHYSAISGQSIYGVPTGRVLTAFAAGSELRQLKATYGLPGETWNNIDDDGALEAALEPIRKTGHCEMESTRLQAFGIGFPVLGQGGTLLAAVGCLAPKYRCDPSMRARMLTCLRDAASVLAGLLTGHLAREAPQTL